MTQEPYMIPDDRLEDIIAGSPMFRGQGADMAQELRSLRAKLKAADKLAEAAKRACKMCRDNYECNPHEDLEEALAAFRKEGE